MASVKDLRNKALSDMSYDELSDYIKRAEAAGYSRSESKDLGKAEDLRKTLRPENYGSETVASAKKKLMNSTTKETQEKLGFRTTTGLTSNAGRFGNEGNSVNLQEIYDQALNDPALKALEDELVAKKKARDDAEADINDNPYYTEATRVGRIAKLGERANDEINTLQYQIDQKKADAQLRVNIATQQYNIDSSEYQKNLSKLNLLISSGAIANASGSDIAQIALSTGMTTGMVSAIQEAASKQDISPHVVNSTDDNGNVTVSIIDLNTGELIASNSLGAIGKGTSGGGSGSFDISNFWGAINSGEGATPDISSLW